MTKIEKCHADIVAPPFYHIKPLADHRGLGSGLAAKLGPDAPESRTWRERVPQLFFRGSEGMALRCITCKTTGSRGDCRGHDLKLYLSTFRAQ